MVGRGGRSPLTNAPSSPRALAPRDAGAEPSPAARGLWHALCTVRSDPPAARRLHLRRSDFNLRPPASCSPRVLRSADQGCCSSAPRRQGAGGGRGRSGGASSPRQPSGSLHGAALLQERLQTHAPGSVPHRTHLPSGLQQPTLKHPLQRRHAPILRTHPPPPLHTLHPMMRPPPPPADTFLTLEVTLPCHPDIMSLSQDTLSPRELASYLQTLPPQGYVSPQDTPTWTIGPTLTIRPPSTPVPPRPRGHVVSPPLGSQNPSSWLPELSS